MKFIIDIILALIILISAFIGYKKGFFKLVLPVVTFVLAIYLSFTFSPKVADFLNQKYIEPSIVSAVEEKISGAAENGKNKADDFISSVSKKIGLDLENVFDLSVNENPEVIHETAQNIVNDSIMPVLEKPIYSIVSLVLFLLFSLVLGIVARLLNKMIKAGAVGTLNQLGGVCLGAAGGIVFIAILCVILYLIINVTENGFLIFTKENLENSYLYNFVITLLFK